MSRAPILRQHQRHPSPLSSPSPSPQQQPRQPQPPQPKRRSMPASSPSNKRQRLLPPIRKEMNEQRSSEETTEPMPLDPMISFSPNHDQQQHPQHTPSEQINGRYQAAPTQQPPIFPYPTTTTPPLQAIPEAFILGSSTPRSAEKSVEERLSPSLVPALLRRPALPPPRLPLDRVAAGGHYVEDSSSAASRQESSSSWEESETPLRQVSGLVPREQSLLGPGRNWKDAWFYNLFCEFKIFAQVVGMRGLVVPLPLTLPSPSPLMGQGREDGEGLEEGEIREGDDENADDMERQGNGAVTNALDSRRELSSGENG